MIGKVISFKSKMFLVTLIFALIFQKTTPVEKFLTNHFPNGTLVIIIPNLDYHHFIFTLPQPKIVATPDNIPNLENYQNYIIIEKNVNEIISNLDLLRHNVNTRGSFLLIFQQNVTGDEMKKLFETLWKFYIYNVVVYVNQSNFVTWYPYDTESRCGTVVNLVTVAKFSNPYADKIPTNLENCPIKATWDEFTLGIKDPFDKKNPGYGIRLLDTVGEVLKSTVVYSERVKYARPVQNKKLLPDYLIKNSFDLGFLVEGTPQPLTPDLEISIPINDIKCFFILPPRRKITNSTDTLVIFSLDVWILLIISVVCMAILIKQMTDDTMETCFFDTLRLLLQCTVRQRLILNTNKKIIFAFFFFYVTNMNWMYVSQLSGVLSKASYEPKISTMEELVESDKQLRFPDGFLGFFRGKDFYEKLLQKRVATNNGLNFYQEWKNFLEGLDHGIIFSNMRLSYIKNPEKLQALTHDRVTTLHYYLVTRRGYPFHENIRLAVLKILEMGLLQTWVYESQVDVHRSVVRDYEEVEGHLDLDRVFCAFVILILGLLGSSVVFVFEIIHNKM